MLKDEHARDPSRALPLSERSIEIIKDTEKEEYRAGLLDTKGEILRQLDRMTEAHEVQVEAVRLERERQVGMNEKLLRMTGLIGPPMLDELEKRLAEIEASL